MLQTMFFVPGTTPCSASYSTCCIFFITGLGVDTKNYTHASIVRDSTLADVLSLLPNVLQSMKKNQPMIATFVPSSCMVCDLMRGITERTLA